MAGFNCDLDKCFLPATYDLHMLIFRTLRVVFAAALA